MLFYYKYNYYTRALVIIIITGKNWGFTNVSSSFCCTVEYLFNQKGWGWYVRERKANRLMFTPLRMILPQQYVSMSSPRHREIRRTDAARLVVTAMSRQLEDTQKIIGRLWIARRTVPNIFDTICVHIKGLLWLWHYFSGVILLSFCKQCLP